MNGNDYERWFPFPLTGASFELPLGIKVLNDAEPLLVRTESHSQELQFKKAQAAGSLDDYFQASPASHRAQVLACRYLRSRHPELDFVADEPHPLLSLAMQIQEDLVLLQGDSLHRLLAGAVFFPSGWSVADKIGQSLQQVHSVVPGFGQALERQTDRLVTHLKMNRPVWRMNWGVRPSDRLDQSPKWSDAIAESAKQIDASNAATHCFFRIERQTLSRLPDSGEILFSIHTRQYPLASLTQTQRQCLYQALTTCPPATLVYKGISAFYDPLIQFLMQDQR